MSTEIWLLITAIIFTLFGRVMERRSAAGMTSRIIEATIDRLIKDEYIKTKLDDNGQVELIKHHAE
jgi:hypothetical protein